MDRETGSARAVVVDEAWKVAVVRSGGQLGLPAAQPEPGEVPELALARVLQGLGLEVQLVASLGERQQDERPVRAFVFHGKGAPGAEGAVQWWPSSRALRELPLDIDRHWVKRALGPC